MATRDVPPLVRAECSPATLARSTSSPTCTHTRCACCHHAACLGGHACTRAIALRQPRLAQDHDERDAVREAASKDARWQQFVAEGRKHVLAQARSRPAGSRALLLGARHWCSSGRFRALRLPGRTPTPEPIKHGVPNTPCPQCNKVLMEAQPVYAALGLRSAAQYVPPPQQQGGKVGPCWAALP